MEENMKEVFSADQIYKIELIQEILDKNNIENFVLNQKGSALRMGDILLYVDEKDEAKAKELIKGHEI